MRLVIEVTEAERDALRTYLSTSHPTATYSALFRVLMRLAMDGTVPHATLHAGLGGQRPVLNMHAPAPISPPDPPKRGGSLFIADVLAQRAKAAAQAGVPQGSRKKR